MNSLIWKGASSTTIEGLLISELPPITKPQMRVKETVIDGRDGSIFDELGYSAYDKKVSIGLHGNFDINRVIKYFTGEGEVVFSNEPDKIYKAKIVDKIDYDRLLRYRKAVIPFRVQPYKYKFNEAMKETQTATAKGTSIVINDSADANLKAFKIHGKSTQSGTPTPDAPIDIVSLCADGTITTTVNDKTVNLTVTNGLKAIKVTDKSLATYTDANGQMWCADEIDLERGVYIQRVKKFELAVANMNNLDSFPGWKGLTELLKCFSVGTNAHYTLPSNIGNNVSINMTNSNCVLYLRPEVYGKTQTEWMASYPDLVCTFLLPLITPIETALTDEQIAICKSLESNEPTTTITNDENAFMSVEYIKPFEVFNEGLENSKPLILLKGSGTVEISVNGTGIFSYTFPDGESEVYIDCEKEDAYLENTLKNRNMNGEFPTLLPGTNKIGWSGDVESISILPRSRWL